MNTQKVIGWLKIGSTIIAVGVAILSGDWKTALEAIVAAVGVNGVLSGAAHISTGNKLN